MEIKCLSVYEMSEYLQGLLWAASFTQGEVLTVGQSEIHFCQFYQMTDSNPFTVQIAEPWFSSLLVSSALFRWHWMDLPNFLQTVSPQHSSGW
tara:strand:+ start:331 stop:609 length:279 start_codon:yes stop_codon:yes gene_type:complete